MTVVATSFAFISAILVIYIPKELVREVAREQSHVHRAWAAGPQRDPMDQKLFGSVDRLSSDHGKPGDPGTGWLRYQTKGLDQLMTLVSCPRYYGGRQWYFVCPVTNKRGSVLWRPPGAKEFRSRQAWGRKVAYRTQFLSVYDRGHAGKAKIKARLIGDLDPDDWELPPKPKWMRWRTYNRLVERFDAYDDMTYPDDSTLPALVAKLSRRVR
jgi:hypothetical protein